MATNGGTLSRRSVPYDQGKSARWNEQKMDDTEIHRVSEREYHAMLSDLAVLIEQSPDADATERYQYYVRNLTEERNYARKNNLAWICNFVVCRYLPLSKE